MPYIDGERREKLRYQHPETAGELNYVFSGIAISYLKSKKLNYQTLNDISGAFTEALNEFRRRVIVPYELEKIAENGDLPWPT